MATLLASQPPKSLLKAARRLNPALELEVDVVAVARGVGASTTAEWNAGTKTNTAVDDTGAVRLAEAGSATLFSSGGTSAEATTHYQFFSSANSLVTETLWIDVWPDPARLGPNGFTLHSLDVVLGRKTAGKVFGSGLFGALSPSNYLIQFARLDENWNREVLAERVALPASSVTMDGSVVSINLRAIGRLITVRTGRMRTRTGTGLDASGAERVVDFTLVGDKKVSHLEVPMGFSIGITVDGPTPSRAGAFLGMLPTGTYPGFDLNQFWRVNPIGEYESGPYSPDADGPSPHELNRSPGYGYLTTGAVPGYGAIPTATTVGGIANGQWGQAREVDRWDKPNTGSEPGRNRAWHVIRGVAYASVGTIVKTFDLGATPVNEVHFRADATQPTGTGVSYALERSTDNATWVSIGVVQDGAILAPADRARYYRLTATLTASSDTLATPVLQAVALTERVRYGTYRYAKEVDSSVSIDPVTGQSEIGELALPLLKAGRNDGRDIVTKLATEYAPANIEAWVYARETTTGTRHFLNLFRLENRDPGLGTEKLTFVSGMDRLKVTVPQKLETAKYPTNGTDASITGVSYNGTTRELTVTVAGTPFLGVNIVGWRYEGVTGVLANTNWAVATTPAPTNNTFVIVLEDAAQTPSVGDTFRLHSDITNRPEVVYSGQDFAAVYADLLANQAAVPQRYRGQLPATTGRTTTNRLKSDGRPALEPLQEVALHCGGGIVWRKGRIDFVDLYGPKHPVALWSERDYTELTTTVGAGRRMPSVGVKYGYDHTAGKFTHEVTYDDWNAVQGWGRANLFDVSNLPDELCKWNDYEEGKYLAGKMLGAWSTGVRVWKVKMAHPWPWVEMGMAVTVSTDVYTDRRLSFSADSLTDSGEPVRGRTSALGVVVGRNLLGTEFSVAIMGLDSVVAATGTNGTQEVPELAELECPAITLSESAVVVLGWIHLSTVVVSFTPPTSPFFDRMEFDVTDTSGESATEVSSRTSPVRVRVGVSGATFVVTPRIVTTAGVATEGTPVSITLGQSLSIGRQVPRTTPGGTLDGFDLKATDTNGWIADSNVKESGLKPVNLLLAKALPADPDNADSLTAGALFRVPRVTAQDGSGNIDLAGSGWVNKVLDRIGDGATYKRLPFVGGGAHLFDNLNFETPLGVDGTLPGFVSSGGTPTLITSGQFSGSQSLKIVTSSIFGGVVSSRVVRCSPGEQFKLSAALRVDSGEAFCQLQFQDAAGAFLGGVTVQTTTVGSWIVLGPAIGTAPAGTVRAQLLLLNSGAGGGTCYFDNIEVIRLARADDEVAESATRSFINGGVVDSSRKLRRDLAASDGTTLAGQEAVGDFANLVYNASFEADANSDGVPDGWTLNFEVTGSGLTAARSTTVKTHGLYGVLLFPADSSSGGALASTPFAVRPGAALSCSVDVIQQGSLLGGFYYRVLFYGDTNDFSRASLGLLSFVDVVDGLMNTVPATFGASSTITGLVTVPAGARYCRVALYCWPQRPGETLGVDNVRVVDDGGARAVAALEEGGSTLRATVRQSDGVTSRIIAKGHTAGTGRHNAVVPFPVTYQAPPLVLLRGGALAEPRSKWGVSGSGSETGAYNSALPTYDDMGAINVTATQFTIRARLRQKSAVTAINHDFPTNSLTSPGATTAVALTSAPANNDQYTVRWTVSLSLLPSAGETMDISVDVAVDTWDSVQWTERASVNYSMVSDPGTFKSQSYTGQTATVAVSGLNAASAQVRVRFKARTLNGIGSFTSTVHAYAASEAFRGVSYNASTDSFASKTPDTDDTISWEAIEVS